MGDVGESKLELGRLSNCQRRECLDALLVLDWEAELSLCGRLPSRVDDALEERRGAKEPAIARLVAEDGGDGREAVEGDEWIEVVVVWALVVVLRANVEGREGTAR